MKFKYGR